MSDNLIGKKEIWIVGAGPMAMDHARVLLHLGMTPTVIGRGEVSAKKFEDEIGISVKRGGLQKFLNQNKPSKETFIIIAVGTEVLMHSLVQFIDLDFARILIEKPVAISIEELLENEDYLRPIQEKVFVAYNRRFYPSVKKAMELIKKDGGLQSMHFDFTEWSYKIEPLLKAPGVKENWFFANSSHVVDLAFFFAGQPTEWQAYSKKGKISWHDKSFFTGAGITEKGVLFSYKANWESAGRWSIELLTKHRKLILCPLEELKQVKRGKIEVEDIVIDNELNFNYKPGILRQLESFLSEGYSSALISLKEHIYNTEVIYSKINSSSN